MDILYLQRHHTLLLYRVALDHSAPTLWLLYLSIFLPLLDTNLIVLGHFTWVTLSNTSHLSKASWNLSEHQRNARIHTCPPNAWWTLDSTTIIENTCFQQCMTFRVWKTSPTIWSWCSCRNISMVLPLLRFILLMQERLDSCYNTI